MRYLSFLDPSGRPTFGQISATGKGVLNLGARSGQADLAGYLAAGSGGTMGAECDFDLGEITFLPVIPNPSKIFCVGINYASHLEETGRPKPEKPMIFVRSAQSQVGHGQPILRPAVSKKLDFEAELAVVIGQPARYVTPQDAARYVAGYSCYNDGSMRDWQRHTTQFGPGKNFPSTGAFGPWLVTPDEVGSIGPQRIVARLNGAVMQDGRLDDLIFDVPSLISYCSYFSGLEPGDVIVTGTTGGVGAFRDPPVWLAPGDLIEVEIDGIGILSNPVEEDRKRPERDLWQNRN